MADEDTTSSDLRLSTLGDEIADSETASYDGVLVLENGPSIPIPMMNGPSIPIPPMENGPSIPIPDLFI